MITQEQVDRHERITGHALFAPSSMHRIIACPASIQETLRIPPPESSDYAKHGTKLHDVIAEESVKHGEQFEATVHSTRQRLDIEDRDKDLIEGAMDFYCGLLANYGDFRVFTEAPVSLAYWGIPEVFGTGDKLVVSMEQKRLLVNDWKFGAGVQVKVENNAQLQTYGAGGLAYILKEMNLDPTTLRDWVVELSVIQPALDAYDTWEVTAPHLLDWVEREMKPALALAKSEEPPYGPSEYACKFCNAGGVCRARYSMQKENARRVFEAHQKLTRLPSQISREELSRVLRSIAELEQYFKDIRTFAYAEIASARSIPDWKLVHGRSLRKWKDEDHAMQWLTQFGGVPEDKLYTKKPKGPAAVEKINRAFKKDPDFAELVEKPPGKPQLVPENDPREAISLNDPKTVFEGVAEYEE